MVTLTNTQLWRSFFAECTEMIINKSGRRMFPHIEMKVNGLDPDSLYSIYLRILPVNKHRYRYSQKEWSCIGTVPYLPQTKPQKHPDSSALGHHWNNASRISFRGVKLSNDKADVKNVVLESMHKYVVEILITSPGKNDQAVEERSFLFPETTFIAVTAYQNDFITKLKIQNNPFARAFRKSTHCLEEERLNSKRKTDLVDDILPPNGSAAPNDEQMFSPHPAFVFPQPYGMVFPMSSVPGHLTGVKYPRTMFPLQRILDTSLESSKRQYTDASLVDK